MSAFGTCGLVPYNPGAVPEFAYAHSEYSVVDGSQSFTPAILNYVGTAGTSSGDRHTVSEGRQHTRKRQVILSSSDSASEELSGIEEDELSAVLELRPLPKTRSRTVSSRSGNFIGTHEPN